MRTPKGMTGPRSLGDQILEGSFHAHQVPLPKAKNDPEQFKALVSWLSSYNISELLVNNAGDSKHVPAENEGSYPEALFSHEVLRILPERVERRMGMIKESYAGYEALDVPDFKDHVDGSGKDASPMKALGGKHFFMM